MLLRRALDSCEHFDFLLHRVNWFAPPLTHYPALLLKLLRIYTGQTRHAAKVIYNLLIESVTVPEAHPHALSALIKLFGETYDKKLILACLRNNYPHKLCPLEAHQLYMEGLVKLSEEYPGFRTDCLEMMVESLAQFDTEVVAGDEWVHRPFPEVGLTPLRTTKSPCCEPSQSAKSAPNSIHSSNDCSPG